MLTIKRRWLEPVLCFGCALFVAVPLLVGLFSDEEPTTKLVCCLLLGPIFLFFLWLIPEAGAEYVLDTSGITIRPLIGKERVFLWKDYPYRYVMRMSNKYGWYKQFVFSREPISYWKRKRCRLGSRHHLKTIELDYTTERERFLRELLPGNGLSYIGKMTGPSGPNNAQSCAGDVFTPISTENGE